MTTQLTILGLGQIGASIGLALAGNKQFFRVGHDIEFGQARRAEKMGAVDKVVNNLYAAVEKADIVILALPADQIELTLDLIAKDLKPGVVVMDMAPIKTAVAEWVQKVLPSDRYYVGLTPVINPIYLLDRQRGIEAAHADLFRKGLLAIVTPGFIPSSALQMAIDLATLLGAEYMLTDVTEIDGLMAAAHILPQIMSAALLEVTFERPGWQEVRKLAGRAYAQVTEPMTIAEDPAALACAAVNNSVNVARLLRVLIDALQEVREEVLDQDTKKLEKRFTRLRDGHLSWLQDRGAAGWAIRELTQEADIPTSGEFLGRLIGIRPKKRKIK